jgi:hypothetical protein
MVLPYVDSCGVYNLFNLVDAYMGGFINGLWRLRHKICQFVSELFIEVVKRLHGVHFSAFRRLNHVRRDTPAANQGAFSDGLPRLALLEAGSAFGSATTAALGLGATVTSRNIPLRGSPANGSL